MGRVTHGHHVCGTVMEHTVEMRPWARRPSRSIIFCCSSYFSASASCNAVLCSSLKSRRARPISRRRSSLEISAC